MHFEKFMDHTDKKMNFRVSRIIITLLSLQRPPKADNALSDLINACSSDQSILMQSRFVLSLCRIIKWKTIRCRNNDAIRETYP